MGIEDRYLDPGLPLLSVINDWSAWLAGEPDEETIQAIREATATGRACGSDDFIRSMETHLGCLLRPQKRGRKPRPTDVEEANQLVLPTGW